MRDQHDRAAAPPELGELVEALVRERLVADGQHLVDQQDVGIDVDRHGEAQPHVHAGRVGLDRRVDEVLELRRTRRSRRSGGQSRVSRQAEHHAVDEDVLAAGDLRVKSGAELDQRRDAAVHPDRRRASACRCRR